jgi:adenylate kinase
VRLVLLGAPGSGKGTQGEALSRHLGVPHVSSGELLRDHMAGGTDLGAEVGTYVRNGQLVPDDLVLRVVGDAVTAAADARGYILDGFPRTLAQAERAYELAKPAGVTADAVIHLKVPDEVVRERLAHRTDGRPDDDPEVIERRLHLYHEATGPLLDFYAGRGILVDIDAARPTSEVTTSVLAALDS